MSALEFSTTIGNAWFPAPTFTASGCASSGRELAQFFPLREMGGVVTKSVMSRVRPGRPTPRMAETPSGMLNSIGLQGPGIDAFLTQDIPYLIEQKARVIVSIAGETVEEYSTLARKLRSVSGISAVEVNISCPNVENRGLVFACDPDASRRVIDGVRRTLGGELPIIAKLSPDVTDLVSIAKGVVDAGADGLAQGPHLPYAQRRVACYRLLFGVQSGDFLWGGQGRAEERAVPEPGTGKSLFTSPGHTP